MNMNNNGIIKLISTFFIYFLYCCNTSNKKASIPIQIEKQSEESNLNEVHKEINKNKAKTKNIETNKVVPKNGVYLYVDNSVEIQIIISEDVWNGKTKIISGLGDEYDNSNIEYESGIVKGNDLYESSGFVKIGVVENKLLKTSIGGNSITLTRK